MRAKASISQSALTHNLSVVKQLTSGAKVVSMIKANAYGHHLDYIHPLIDGSDMLAVSELLEAEKLRAITKRMQEVVEKGGYGTSVTPVSQFYWQQAYANVMFGDWKQIAPGYGKMVLGRLGKTPVAPDPEIVKIASEKLGLEPTTENAIDIADADPAKSLQHAIDELKEAGIEITEENIFIAAACQEKGIAFLQGKGELNVRKISEMKEDCEGNSMGSGNYTVVVDGQKFSVQVAEGDADIQVIKPTETSSVDVATSSSGGTEVGASVNGNVWKILVKEGQAVTQDQTIMILEAMKMEIDIKASSAGTISKILVSPNDAVEEGQALAVIA